MSFPLVTANPNPFYTSDNVAAVAVIDDEKFLIHNYNLTLNCHGATDEFNFALPISVNDDFSMKLAATQQNIDSDRSVFGKIYAGYPRTQSSAYTEPSLNGLSLRFSGIIDSYRADCDNNIVTFNGRSLGAPLTTQKIQTPFSGPSITTVEWITEIATAYGLNVNIFAGIKPLTMQQVLGHELQTGIHTYPIWNLILQCAVQDDVDVWVDATGTLWYYPSESIPRLDLDVAYQRDLYALILDHGIQMMRNIEVHVFSYVPKVRMSTGARSFLVGGQTFTVQSAQRLAVSNPVFGTTESVTSSTNAQGVTSTNFTTTGGGATEGSVTGPANYSGKQIYEVWLKNKTQKECEDYARKYFRQILLHEYQATFKMPVTRGKLQLRNSAGQAVNNFGIASRINLSGAPYAKFNDALWPRQISESFAPGELWEWSVVANVNRPAQGGV